MHRFEYDERGQVVRVYFNDSLYIERVFKDANIIRYQCYFPDPTFIEPPVLVEVSLNSSGKIHDIFNFNDFFSSAYGVDNLPVYIGVSPTLSMYIPERAPGSVDGNVADNFTIDDDSIKFDFLFYQMPNWPTSWDVEEVLSNVTWYYYNTKSPVIMPMQDLAFLGAWGNYNASFLLQTLLYVLNLSGYDTYISDKLVKEKSYSNIYTDRFYFTYEYNSEGYVTHMHVKNGSANPDWDTFEFTYSE